MRAICAVEDKIVPDAYGNKVIEPKRDVVVATERTAEPRSLSLAAEVFEFTNAEVPGINALGTSTAQQQIGAGSNHDRWSILLGSKTVIVALCRAIGALVDSRGNAAERISGTRARSDGTLMYHRAVQESTVSSSSVVYNQSLRVGFRIALPVVAVR